MCELSVVLQGQLGNILFQLSFVKALGIKYKLGVVIYSKYITGKSIQAMKYLKTHNSIVFDNIKICYNDPITTPQLVYEDPSKPCVYEPEYFERFVNVFKDKILLFVGYFQSEKYFNKYLTKDEILSYIDFNENLNNEMIKFNSLTKHYFIHVRGTDFIGCKLHEHQNINSYYEKCISLVNEENPEGVLYFIFSDDEKYAESLPFVKKLNKKINCGSPLNDLFIMTQVDGVIIPNSTFGWWGAYLNKKAKIYMPKKWWSDTAVPKLRYDDIFITNAILVDI